MSHAESVGQCKVMRGEDITGKVPGNAASNGTTCVFGVEVRSEHRASNLKM